MKINLDDPKLTAFALDELPEPERSAFARAVAESPEAQAFVADTQQLARVLRGEFREELQQASAKPRNIMPLPEERATWPETRWSSLALAASLAIAAVVAAVFISDMRDQPAVRTAHRASKPPLQMEFDLAPPADDRASLAPATEDENAFVFTASNPVSRFPLRVGTASYSEVQRQIAAGVRPPRDAVRIEELVNHFDYEYPPPEAEEPFSLNIDAATCPWAEGHLLVRIRVKAREANGGGAVAEDAAIQVTFDPAETASYRLIGYEGRGRADGGSDGARAAIPPGYATTALYEIIPAPAAAAPPLASASINYRVPQSAGANVIERRSVPTPVPFDAAPADFRFAAAVAQFGMIVRGSPHRGAATLASVADWAHGSTGADASGERAEFLVLVARAQTMAF